MKIVITGGTGLVGQELIKKLFLKGYTDISVYTRNSQAARKSTTLPIKFYDWAPGQKKIDKTPLLESDCIVNLVGENIASKRWTSEQKERISQSRTEPLKLLLDNIKDTKKRIKFISASAIGIYGDRDEEELVEGSTYGQSFLSKVCQDWEAPLLTPGHNIKTHILRIGLVLSHKGGALQKMVPPFRLGLGGHLGSGKQYMSWIHLEDLVDQFIYLIEHDVSEKIFNAVSPQPVTNKMFTKLLAKELGRIAILPAPKVALKIALGEMSTILLTGQKVTPKNFLEIGFDYKYPDLTQALNREVSHIKKGEAIFEQNQWIAKKPEEIFPFFSDEYNLEKITPDFLGFKVLGKSTDKIQTGTLIDYKLKIHGIPIKWKTEILDFQKNEYFIDQQLKGPYKKWYHQHFFFSSGEGTLMIDHVTYKPPLGILGRFLAGWYIRKDIRKIFNYRLVAIKEILK